MRKLSRQYELTFSKNSREKVHINYPKEGQNISSPSYTFNISTNVQADRVELSIAGGNWEPCREALGTWWYDWYDYEPGPYAAHARLVLFDGRKIVSSLRRFVVKI